MNTYNDKAYIYNFEQAYFYIENGIRPVEHPRVHKVTGKIFFAFSKEETEDIYTRWINRNKK